MRKLVLSTALALLITLLLGMLWIYAVHFLAPFSNVPYSEVLKFIVSLLFLLPLARARIFLVFIFSVFVVVLVFQSGMIFSGWFDWSQIIDLLGFYSVMFFWAPPFFGFLAYRWIMFIK